MLTLVAAPPRSIFERRGIADAVRPKQPHDIARALDRGVVPTCDDVADQKPGFCRRSVRVDAHNQYAGAATVLAGHTHVLQTGTQVAASHVALGQQLIDRAVDGRARDGERTPARPGHRHPEHMAMCIDQRSALSGGVETQIEAQERIDRPAAHAVPGSTDVADAAERRDRRAAIVADGENEMTDAQRAGVAVSATASPSAATRSTATSVDGSRPASVAVTWRPPGNVTAMSLSCSSISSAVTMTPGRQWMPLMVPRPPWATATTALAVRSTTSATAVESARSEIC